MALDWVLDWTLGIIAIILIFFLSYWIYNLSKPSEGFITAVPPQEYTIPQLTGVSGRYVRIRPSITHGDGYLSISQIQVFDSNGNNVALRRPVYATSSGGSPIDQAYGRAIQYGGVYQYVQGIGANPSSVVDGITAPRFGLTETFETSIQNMCATGQTNCVASLPDTQYLEIDLSANVVIKSIIYTGRADTITGNFPTIYGTYDTLDQVSRLTNMRLEIYDQSRVTNSQPVFNTNFSVNLNTHTATIPITSSMFTINKGSGSSTSDFVNIPNLKSYKDAMSAFSTMGPKTVDANLYMINSVNKMYTSVNSSYSAESISVMPAAPQNMGFITDSANGISTATNAVANFFSPSTPGAATSLQYTFDISGRIFSSLAASSPINFYNEIYTAIGCPSSPVPCTTDTICPVKPIDPETGAAIACRTTACPAAGNLCAANSTPFMASTKFSLDPYEKRMMGSSSIFPTPPVIPEISVQIFGTASAAAKAEMANSIAYCKSIFLGNPDIVENYIALKYNTDPRQVKPYIRSPSSTKWCMPDIMQVFQKGTFETLVMPKNVAWNYANGNCNTELTPTMLALIPYASRNFIVQWIQNRSVRYIHYTNMRTLRSNANAVDCDATTTTGCLIEGSASLIQIPTYIDLKSVVIFDSIAQQFYEMLNGQFTMSYIYDVLPVGRTMLDIRFDLVIHTDAATSYGPIAALKAQYQSFLAAGSRTFTQEIVDQANIDYRENMNQREIENINNKSSPYQGAVVRLFYTLATNNAITITGMIFDDRAVTSFIRELNGGISTPIGSNPGNVNYTPNIEYTRNTPQETLNCSDPVTIRRIMDDYLVLVNSNHGILQRASPPLDIKSNTLYINRVVGATQISPTQCALEWIETLYDPVTNLPIPRTTAESGYTSIPAYISNVCALNNIDRYGLFSYKIDKENWYSPNLLFDPSGFKLYPTATIPACIFDPSVYAASVGNRFSGMASGPATTTAIQNDYIRTSFKGGKGTVCQQTLPSYTFNAADYLASIGSSTGTITDPATHYATIGLAAGLPVKGPTTIAKLASPVLYTKPLPNEPNLDNGSGICATTNCQDLDVLYSLVDQYNSNPSLPGAILRVKRAFTANPYQCDVDVDINYDAVIQNIVPQTIVDPVTGIQKQVSPMIKKGTATYRVVDRKTVQGSKAMTLTGVKTTNMALYTAIDVTNCKYSLSDASGVNSGTTIQYSTPYLYKPMNYVAQLAQLGSSLGSSISQIQSDISLVSGSAKNALFNYRRNTYNAAGEVIPLSVCPNQCSDAAVKNSIMNYYQTTLGLQMSQIIRIGSIDGKTCDVLFTNSSRQTVGMRFNMASSSSGCAPTAWSFLPTTQLGSYTDIKNTAVPLSTGALTGSTSGFTDYSPPPTEEAYPLKARSFGLDRARNSTETLTQIQFKNPLDQKLPQKDESSATTYRFLRFVPLKTRDPKAFSVSIGKITFFYEELPLALEGKVTNPMGTWEGEMKDITGPGFRDGWTDDHKKPLVFAFKVPIMVDAYSITTSEKEMGSDPVAWRLEGSSNGSFWTTLDTQQRYPTPVERFREISPEALTLPEALTPP